MSESTGNDENSQEDGIGSEHEGQENTPSGRQGVPEHDTGPVGSDAAPSTRHRSPQHGSGGVDSNESGAPGVEEQAQGELFSLEAVSASWSGALPHPSDFREYEATLPGAANRIVAMAEESNSARNNSMTKAVDAEVEYSNNGQIMAFLLAVVGIIAGIVFFSLGNNIAGAVMCGYPLILLVRSFLPNKSDPS